METKKYLKDYKYLNEMLHSDKETVLCLIYSGCDFEEIDLELSINEGKICLNADQLEELLGNLVSIVTYKN
jgi:hypothetical protein